jgi:hypothetical protein
MEYPIKASLVDGLSRGVPTLSKMAASHAAVTISRTAIGSLPGFDHAASTQRIDVVFAHAA